MRSTATPPERTELPRRCRGRATAATALLIGLLGGAVHAGDASPEAQVADRVVAALAADPSALRDLASRDDPDPWVVADELLGRGRADAAKAFAAAGPRVAVQGLDDVVATAAKTAGGADADVRRRLAAARDALDADDAPRALTALEGIAPAPSIVAVRVLLTRGRALQALRRQRESAATATEAAAAAERLGWLAGRAQALEQAARSHYRGGALVPARETARAWLEVEERLGSTQGRARATWVAAAVGAYAGEVGPAEALATQALRLATEAGDVEYEGHVLGTLSFLASARGDAAASADLARRAVARFEAPAPPAVAARFRRDERLVAQTRAFLLVGLARVEADAGRADEAERLLARAIEVADGARAPATAAAALLLRGSLRERAHDGLAALAAYEQSLERATAAGDAGAAASARRRIGGARRTLRDLPGALAQLRTARDEIVRVGNRREGAWIQIEIGRTLAELGELPEASAAFETARAEADALGLRPVVAAALEHGADVRMRQGRYGDALSAFDAALVARRAIGPPSETAALLYALGVVARRLGDPVRAAERFEEARALAKTVGDGRVGGRAALAAAEDALAADDLDAARTLLGEAEAELHAARDPVADASALLVRARVEDAAGDPTKAAEAAARAVTLLDGADAPRSAAAARLRLARSLADAGRTADARAVLGKGTERAREASDPEALAQGLWGLAALELRAGRPAEAAARAGEALDVLEPVGRDLGEGEGVASRAPFAPIAGIGARASLEAGDVRGAFRFVESGRAATLLASLGSRESLRRAVVPDALRAEEAAARAQEALAIERVKAARSTGERAAVRLEVATLDAATVRLKEVVGRIQRSARAASAAVYPRPLALDEATRLLRPGDAMVLFETSSERAFALVLGDGPARAVDLGASAALREACARLLPEGSPPVDPAGATPLRERIVDPLRLSDAVRRVVVSPDGALAFVPFCLLLPARELAYVPSATVLALLGADGAQPGVGVLALGDPDYGGTEAVAGGTRGGDAEARGGVLVRIPATRDEAKAVGDVVLVGAEASETGFLRTIATRPRWRAVHFACHGLARVEGLGFSALALTADAANDGFLTALDVSGARVPAELVVLSGCETVKGRLVGGEGVVGLPRAFLVAGASRVLASAWKVDDEATRALMERFYAGWNPKDGRPALAPTAALVAAQAYVRAQPRWSHPSFWAAWSLWGALD